MTTKNKIIFIILLFIIESSSNAQSTYNIVYEKQFHQNTAAENFNAGFHIYDYIDSSFVPKINFFPQSSYGKIINPIFRLSKLFFTNYLIGDYMLTMNHELGHGYRMIEAGGSIIEIDYNLPPPFSYEFSSIDMTSKRKISKCSRYQ